MVVIAALALAGPFIAGVGPELDEIARLTGVREQPPQPGGPFQPADIPHVSVQPLMRYLGTDDPVVPAAAVVSRNERRVVFTLPTVNYPPGNTSTTPIRVSAQPVTVDREIERAVTISSGLTPCSVVVVAPPATLGDGDQIRSYQSDHNEGPSIDYAVLFGGRAPAAPSRIEGGIAHEEHGVVTLAIMYQGAPPEAAAAYVYTSPTGNTQRLPFAENTEVRIPRNELRANQTVGEVEVRDSSGKQLTRGHLEWYCGTQSGP